LQALYFCLQLGQQLLPLEHSEPYDVRFQPAADAGDIAAPNQGAGVAMMDDFNA